MQRILSALALGLALGLPAAAAAEPAAVEQRSPPEDELRLAEQSFAKGLYEFVALRLAPSVGREFPGRDRAVLLLAESEYLCGRPREAERLLADFPEKFPGSPHLLEYRLWAGRLDVEYQARQLTGPDRLRRLLDAENRLRPLLDELTRDEKLPPETRKQLQDHCRYYLCLALVEQGTIDKLGDEGEKDPKTREEPPHKMAAIKLLKLHIKTGTHLQAEAHVLLGRARYLRGLPDECFDKLQVDFLDQPAGRSGRLRAEALYWQAEARYGQARWREAAGLFARADETARRCGAADLHARALYGRGWALEKSAADVHRAGLAGEKELLEDALACYQQVFGGGEGELAPPARLRAGDILRLLGRHGEAQVLLGALHADKVFGPEALYLTALADAGLGEFAKSQALLDAARKLLGDSKLPLAAKVEAARGRNAFELGQWPDAAAAFSRALELTDANVDRYEARLWLARVAARTGRPEEAAREAQELLNTVPAVEVLHKDCLDYHLGEFLLAMARGGKASLTYQSREEGKQVTKQTLDLAVYYFSDARLSAPRGPFAAPAMLGAAQAHLLKTPPSTPEALRLFETVRQEGLATPEQIVTSKMGTARTLAAGKRYQKAAAFLQAELLKDAAGLPKEVRREELQLCADCQAAAGEAVSAAETYRKLADDWLPVASRQLPVTGNWQPATEAARARMNCAAQLRLAGRPDQAAAELSGLYSVCPPELGAEVAWRGAEAFREAGQTQEALKFYLQAAAEKSSPRRAEAQISAAELRLAAGQAKEAEQLALEAAEGLVRRGPADNLLAARAALVRAKSLMAEKNAAGSLASYRLAASEAAVAANNLAGSRQQAIGSEQPTAYGLPQPEMARRLEFDALMGLAEAFLAMSRNEDAAAGFLRAAYLRDRETDAEAFSRLKRRSDDALLRAADSLAAAGQAKAAKQIRALLALDQTAPVTISEK